MRSDEAPRALVLAGGRGRRLDPVTATLPKPLVTVAGETIIERMIRTLAAAGIAEVVIALGHLGDAVRDHLSAATLPPGVRLQFVQEDAPLGTAGPLTLLGGIDDPIVVANGDVITDLDVRALVDDHRASGATLTVAVRPHETSIDLGVVELDGTTVTGWAEKPSLVRWVSMGVYVVSRTAVERLGPGAREDMPELVQRCLEDGLEVHAHQSRAYWIDVGSPADHARAEADAASRPPPPG